MGIAYNPSAKKWDVTYEKADYPISNTVSYSWQGYPAIEFNLNDTPQQIQDKVILGVYGETPGTQRYDQLLTLFNLFPNLIQEPVNAVQSQQKIAVLTNQDNEKLNKRNTALNNAYNTVLATANSTVGGDYVAQRDGFLNAPLNFAEAGIPQAEVDKIKADLTNQYKLFYQTEKLQPWDSNLGAKPPYGTFDSKYYKENNPVVAQQWADAVAKDDIDITERYGETNFYLQHYTTQGKPAGARGNAPEETIAAKQYVETKPTDKDIQDARDLQLGVDTTTQTNRVLNIPEVAAEWEKAKNRDPYWVNLAQEKFLDINKPDEFAVLFRLSDRPEDKQVSLNYNINAGYGITQLEDALNQAVGEKATVDVKKFGALTQNVLKDTIAEVKKAKQKEEFLGLLGGFGGFGEIMDINKTLSDSILKDTGVGGVLSFAGGNKPQESLEKGLQNITGVRNNVTYNWQQWFDTQLKTKYDQALELGYTTDQAQQMVNVEADFARNFIDKYLTPRFNQSKSMDEFVEYLDVRQSEQNPFQTQDMVNAVTQVASLRSQQYLDSIKAAQDRYFDSNFYFNPTGDKAREAEYATQAATVSKDWEDAKNGDPYWSEQAYRFGVDVNDKDAFARMHFQVKGQGQGYDAADDILTASKVQSEIYDRILPALKEEALKQGSIFGQFITPEEFADQMLQGVDPSNKAGWEEVLQRFGLTNFKGTVDELKEYIKETLRTGSAQEIRENIKYLNEKRKRPTQQILGLTYIERPEDYTNTQAKPETELYKVFQTAGYQGTEDEFYQNFFPDLDRSEQTVLTKAGKDSALKTFGLDLTDPFASLGTIESFFGDETDTDASADSGSDTGTSSGFFKLGLGDEENTDYKSATGSKILGEFTSMFKGL